jgi:hypothetical protein
MSEEKVRKAINMYIEPETYRRFRVKMIELDTTAAKWFLQQVEEVIK